MKNKPPTSGAYSFSAVFAWATYDLANTIFAINILSLYFPLWMIQDLQGSDFLYATAVSASLFFASLLMPFLGTLSDYLQRRMIFLIPTTVLCVLATAFLSQVSSLKGALFLFGLAHFGYQLGLPFYDALLFQVGKPEKVGKISGAGVALGYVGTLLGLLLVRPFVLSGGRQAAFLPTAIFFFLFSLPCFILLREPATRPPVFTFAPLRQMKERLKRGASQFRKGTPLHQMGWAHFFSMLSIQPVILFMSVYTQRVVGFQDRELIVFFFITTLFAILGSSLCGFLTDALGPRKTLLLSFGGWCLGLCIVALTVQRPAFWFAGGLIGAVLGSTWVASRVFVIRFAPPEYLGEIFGCLGLIGRLGAILGGLFWGGFVNVFADHFPWNYRAALLSLLGWMLISFLIFARPSSHFLQRHP